MKLGTQYYRDPNPPERFWRKDLADIAAAGFYFIGCWIPWRYVNPERDRLELDKYRRLFDLAQKNKLGVRVQLVPESAPDWVVREQPDALMINGRGQPVHLHPHPMLQLGGWPGLNQHHPAVRERIDDYFRQVVRALKQHPAILTWNVWNEIQVPLISHDPYTQAAYRAWAEGKYGGLDAYNLANGTRFRSFDELHLPNPDVQGEVMLLANAADLNEFAWAMSVAEGKHRAGLVRALDRTRPVSMHTNAGSPFLGNRDDWRVADHADLYGSSTYNYHPFDDTASAIRQRSVKGPGKWWLTEHCGGRLIYYYGHRTFTGEELTSDFLKAMAHGAAAASVWQYRNERYGQEAPNFGLLDHDGSHSERFRAMAKLARALKRWNPRGLVFDPPVIGLLFEPLDLVFRSTADTWMKQEWQEYKEFDQWLRALLDLGHSPNFLRAEDLAAKAPARTYKVIIAPSLVVLRKGVAETLTTWVRKGGHLIAGPFTGVFDPRGWAFDLAPGDGLSRLFGLHVVRRTNAERFPFRDPKSDDERLAGRVLFEEVAPRKDARVLLTCEGKPAVLHRREGKGTATYLTSFAGAEQANGSTLLREWLSTHLRSVRVYPPIECDGSTWINTARVGRRRILFLHNPTPRSTRASLHTRPPVNLLDLLDGTRFNAVDGRLQVPLSPRQVRVVQIGRG